MKGLMKNIPAVAAVVFCCVSFASCGGAKPEVDATDSESLKNAALAIAQSSAPETESPLLGTLPSLVSQKRAACGAVDSLKAAANEAVAAEVDASDEAEAKKGFETCEAINAAAHAAEDAIVADYAAKLEAASKALANKEIPVEFDEALFADAVVRVGEVNAENGTVTFHATLTLAASLPKQYITYKYVDAKGGEIEKGAVYPDFVNEAGSQIEIKDMKTALGKKFSDFSKISIEKY